MASPQAIHGFFEPYTAPATWVRRVAPAPAVGRAALFELQLQAESDCPCLLMEEHLVRCEALAPGEAREAFQAIEDPADDEADDMRSLDRLLAQKEWKAAALVGGAALEALLVAQLDGREDVAAFTQRQLAMSNRRRDDGARWHKPLREWGLYGLITAALDVGVIQAGGAALCHGARRVRNVMHTGGRVEREHALLVHQAVQLAARREQGATALPERPRRQEAALAEPEALRAHSPQAAQLVAGGASGRKRPALVQATA